jgi:hypothetical protein
LAAVLSASVVVQVSPVFLADVPVDPTTVVVVTGTTTTSAIAVVVGDVVDDEGVLPMAMLGTIEVPANSRAPMERDGWSDTSLSMIL